MPHPLGCDNHREFTFDEACGHCWLGLQGRSQAIPIDSCTSKLPLNSQLIPRSTCLPTVVNKKQLKLCSSELESRDPGPGRCLRGLYESHSEPVSFPAPHSSPLLSFPSGMEITRNSFS